MKPQKRKVIIWIPFLDRKGVRRKRAVSRHVSVGKAAEPTLRVVGPKRADSKNYRYIPKPKVKTPKVKVGLKKLRPKGRKSGMSPRFASAKGERVVYMRGAPVGPYGSDNFEIHQLVPAQDDNLYDIVSMNGRKRDAHPQAFTHDRMKQSYGFGYTQYPDGRVAGVEGWYILPGITPPDMPLTGDVDTANNKALSAIYDQMRGDLDLSIDIAEAHKSAQMVSKMAKGLANLAVTLRKMKRSNPRDWGNLWLEFTYGWKPLAKSIYGTVDRLLNPDNDSGYQVYKGRGQTLNKKNGSFDTSLGSASYIADTSVRVEYGMAFNLAESRLEELAGYTSLNPISIAWELVPYSFVVDWVVDVGGYMRNLENSWLYASDFVSGYKTVTTRSGWTFHTQGVRSRSDLPGAMDVWNVDGGTFVRTKKVRTVLISIPFPSLPAFRPQLGWSRAVSGSALLGQFLPSLKHEALELEIRRPKSRR